MEAMAVIMNLNGVDGDTGNTGNNGGGQQQSCGG